MAVFHSHVVRCACGQTRTIRLADGINADRNPKYRKEIVAGTFHRMGCTKCNRLSSVEKSFFYIDPPKGTFILVKPRQDRHLWKIASAQVEKVTERVPAEFSPPKGRKMRVVFGLAELREKLIAENLELDDRGVEFLKVRVLHEHPFLLKKPRLRLMLNGQKEGRLQFIASYDLDHANFKVSIAMIDAKQLANDEDALKKWAKDARQKFPAKETPEDYWVNFARWSSQPGTLADLRAYARAIEEGNGTLNPKDKRLLNMLKRLPRGETLAGWAKKDLQVLFNEARRIKNGKLQDLIFEVRFGKPLDDEWATNEKPNDIETLWNLMLVLPPSNVEGNVMINEIFALTGDDDDGSGFYEPQTHDIYISARLVSNKENFEDVVRHEIGHAVHEKEKALVDAWLKEKFGWQMWEADDAGINAWVAAMGGWTQWGVSKKVQAEIADFVRKSIGKGESWVPGERPQVPPDHVWWQADFGPRLAAQKTSADWYDTFPTWYRKDGKAFFLNYWYATVAVVNEDALKLIEDMPSTYAAMSPFEFFAELYALYYDHDDPLRKKIPKEVVAWLEENIGQAFQPAKRPARRATPKRHETIRRPPRRRS